MHISAWGEEDLTEFEMAMVKLSSAELDGTTEALTSRIAALEKAVKTGVAVNYQQNVSAQPKIETIPKNSEEIPQDKPLDSDEKQEVLKSEQAQSVEPAAFLSEKEHLKQAPVAKPAPQPLSRMQGSASANLDELYRNAKPFTQWVEIVNNLKPISRAIAAAFAGSSAYESGGYLLIDTNNEMAFDLLKNSSRREEIRKVILETTGMIFKLGPYKRVQKKEEITDPLQTLKESLKDSGVEITEE